MGPLTAHLLSACDAPVDLRDKIGRRPTPLLTHLLLPGRPGEEVRTRIEEGSPGLLFLYCTLLSFLVYDLTQEVSSPSDESSHHTVRPSCVVDSNVRPLLY